MTMPASLPDLLPATESDREVILGSSFCGESHFPKQVGVAPNGCSAPPRRGGRPFGAGLVVLRSSEKPACQSCQHTLKSAYCFLEWWAAIQSHMRLPGVGWGSGNTCLGGHSLGGVPHPQALTLPGWLLFAYNWTVSNERTPSAEAVLLTFSVPP